MTDRVFKYDLDATPDQRLLMPLGAKVLDAQVQNGVLCVWAAVDPNAQPEVRRFRLIGTGEEVPSDAIGHVVTFQASGPHGEAFVFHLFECLP